MTAQQDLFEEPEPVLEIWQLNAKWKKCRRCDHRHEVKQVVTGYGSKQPRVLVVGQFPGRDEDKNGIPFSKRAGQYIQEGFYKRGLTDEQIFWTNIVKCPLPQGVASLPKWQIDNCASFLSAEVKSLDPDLIVGLGNNARRRMVVVKPALKTLEQARLKRWIFQKKPLILVTNPAALLRVETGTPSYDTMLATLRQDFEYFEQVATDLGIIHGQG